MKVRAQIGMVLNLDECIGCHTCSVTCKNVWTTREGVEYAWFNNVETKPGLGYPTDWENQKRWNGGWVRTKSGKLQPKQGGKFRILANIFANPICRKSTITTNLSNSTTITSNRRPRCRPSRRQGPIPRSRATGSRRSKRVRTGRKSLAVSSPSEARTTILKAYRRQFTASTKTPS